MINVKKYKERMARERMKVWVARDAFGTYLFQARPELEGNQYVCKDRGINTVMRLQHNYNLELNECKVALMRLEIIGREFLLEDEHLGEGQMPL